MKRRGLTLIELLVTIVIMVAILAAVIPLLAPNNNARKIREAARQLNSLIQQAQAQAARDGRPAGIAFREFAPGTPPNYSGMALEVFAIAEPEPFSGFSEWSRVTIGDVPAADPQTYGTNAGGNGGTLYPELNDAELVALTFIMAGAAPSPDPLPPGMFRFGDIVEIDKREYMIVDDGNEGAAPNQVDTDSRMLLETNILQCVWMGQKPGLMPPQGVEMYRIRRQPANTSDAPLQFPRGIGIDMQGAGATGSGTPANFDTTNPPPDTVGIVFNSNGSMNSLYFNNNRMEAVNRVYMLLGMFENGNPDQRPEDFDFFNNAITPGDKDALAERRQRVNWLHADSKWVTVDRAGKMAVSNNNVSFDPSSAAFMDQYKVADEPDVAAQQKRQVEAQLNEARQYAEQMQSEGGR